MEKRIAEIEEELRELKFCALCDATVCPCEHHNKLAEELSRLYLDRFYSKFVLGDGSCYITRL